MDGGRFTADDYAKLVGRTFIHHVCEAKNPAKNGKYELHILPGIPDNAVTTAFRAELRQYPFDGASLPVIHYPPKQGSRAEHRRGLCIQNDAGVIEVSSMSGMMRASILATPQTAAVIFKLADALPPDPPAPPPPTSTGFFAVLDDGIDGDSWSSMPRPIPNEWQVMTHDELMEHLASQIEYQEEREHFMETRSDYDIIVIAAPVADVLTDILSAGGGSDGLNTALHGACIHAAKRRALWLAKS